MKALQVIGWKKAVGFVLSSCYEGLLHICIAPQLRVMMLRLVGATIGQNSVVMDVSFANSYHYGWKKLVLGKEVFIADEVMLDLRGGIAIEDSVTISQRATIVTHINVGFPSHPLQQKYPTNEARVIIKRGCYIGTGAIILPGVTIGEGSLVGAGAVVAKNIPPHRLVVGVPAKVIKKL